MPKVPSSRRGVCVLTRQLARLWNLSSCRCTRGASSDCPLREIVKLAQKLTTYEFIKFAKLCADIKMVTHTGQNRDGYAKFACKCRGGSFYVRSPDASHDPRVFIQREYAEAQADDTATEGDDDDDDDVEKEAAIALVDLHADMPALERP